MRVEELVGQRMRDIRERKGLTQEQLGEAIGELLGKTWPRQTVSAAEQGRRAFTAVELVAVSRSLGTYVGQLFRPPLGQESVAVDLGPGIELAGPEAMHTLLQSVDVTAARGTLGTLINSTQALERLANGIDANAQFLLDSLTGLGDDVPR